MKPHSRRELKNLHWTTRNLALQLKGLGLLLGRERNEDSDISDEESEAREGIGKIVERIALDIHAVANFLDEHLAQNSRSDAHE